MPTIGFDKKIPEIRIKSEDYNKMLYNIENNPERWENISQYIRSSIIIMNRAIIEGRINELFKKTKEL